MKKAIGFAIAVVVAVAFVAWPRAQAVEFQTVGYGDFSQTLELEGQSFYEQVKSYVSASGGTLMYCAKEGALIDEGDLLLEIDDGTAQVLDQTQQKLLNLQAARQRPEIVPVWGRAQDYLIKLYDMLALASTSSVDYTLYNEAIENSKISDTVQVLAQDGNDASSNAKAVQLQQQVAQLQTKLEGNRTTSELSGVVIYATEQGVQLAQEETVLMLGTGKVAVAATADSKTLSEIKEGMRAVLTAHGRSWIGEVSGKTSYSVEIKPPDGFDVEQGETVEIRIDTMRLDNAVMVPIECVAADEQGQYVLTRENNKLSRRAVVCSVNDGSHIVVDEGLGIGEQIALFPELYKEGARVK